MKEQTSVRGRVEVSPTAIASLAHEAVVRSYGIVGTVSKNLATGIADVFSRDSKRGVVVHIKDGEITIDLYVTVEYGTRIATVVQSAMSVVKYTVERAVGVPVAQVNVHVESLRVSDPR